MSNRRSFLQSTLGLGATWLSASKVFGESEQNTTTFERIRQTNPGLAFNMPAVTTDIGDLPYLIALHDVWRNAITLQNNTLSGGLRTPMPCGSLTTTINLPNAGGAQE